MLVFVSSLVRGYFLVSLSLSLIDKTQSKLMKPTKQSESKIIIVVPAVEKSQPAKKSKINPWILKVFSVIIITVIGWLAPEAAITIFLIRLLLILIQYLNQK